MNEQDRYEAGVLGRELELIPAEFHEEWMATSAEIRATSVGVNEANRRYNAAILARLALKERMRQ